MNNAGFRHGIGLANNFLIQLIEDHPEVFAVKLTGAGGGGSVFALVNPNKKDEILIEWENRLMDVIKEEKSFTLKFPSYPLLLRKQLHNAQFFKIKMDLQGVKKL